MTRIGRTTAGLPRLPATGIEVVAVRVVAVRPEAFGSGIETDALQPAWGRTVGVGVRGERLRLVA
ncbi:hypothetical protein ABT298_22385 [Streptomyces sp. NPDC001034]|uniref:hypothetical protein n=1 Tax=Streptomyces sp. NPDC001034 TaxID=3154375 RepID=UPI00332594AB